MSQILYYVHDPMCSWCWGFRPVWDEIKANLPGSVTVVNVVGGLAPDSDIPMPTELQDTIQGHWRKIHETLGTEFNFDFWNKNQPRRSTYPACRAVIAAKNQGCEEEMMDAIQHAYYLRALNPSDSDILMRLAWELFSQELDMDLDQFAKDLQSQSTEQELLRQIALARELPAQGFPSLVLELSGQHIPITRDYQDPKVVLAEIEQYLGN